MAQENPTFGCGSFLPGFGPDNIPSIGIGDNVDSGRGVKPPIGGSTPDDSLIISSTFPLPTGGGGGTGGTPGTPGTGGPSVPGAGTGGGGGPGPGPGTGGGGPTTPGTGSGGGPTPGGGVPNPPTVCICRVTQIQERPEVSYSDGSFGKIIFFIQTCEKVPITEIDQNTGAQSIDNYLQSLKNNNYTLIKQEQYGNPDKDCKDPATGECGGACETITLKIRYFKPVIIPEPPDIFPDIGTGVIDSGEPDKPVEDSTIFDSFDTIDQVGGGLINNDQNKPIEPDLGVGVVDTTTPPVDDTGTGVVSQGLPTYEDYIANIASQGSIDLNDPTLINYILNNKPTGLQNPLTSINTSPTQQVLVRNTANTILFNDLIDSNLLYVLTNYTNSGDWDSNKTSYITPSLVYDSLRPEILSILSKIKNHDGTSLSRNQIYSMIGTRIFDGTHINVTTELLKNLQFASEQRTSLNITRSSNQTVNELVALSIIENDMFSIDPTMYGDDGTKKIVENLKIFSSDIDRFIPICIGDDEEKLFVYDDNTFILNEPLPIRDGDFVPIQSGNKNEQLLTQSQKNHAFMIPEKTRQRVVSLLGEDPSRTLEVSSYSTANIEYDYSLSSPRKNFYFLSCVLDTVISNSSSKSLLLKNTKARYDLVKSDTQADLNVINDYIKYKANHKVFFLDDEDLMLDYIEQTSSLYLSQVDVVTDSPKENKTLPIIARNFPSYIIVCPTNRPEFNVFNSKSKIINFEPSGIISRQLKCITSITPGLNNPQSTKIVRRNLEGFGGVNALGETDIQARTYKMFSDDSIYQQTYIKNDQLTSAESFTPNRSKTGLRLIKEIISEIDDNYYLSLNGVGKTLTEFDVFSRLKFKEYAKLTRLENFNQIKSSMLNGGFRDIKVIKPIDKANNKLAFNQSLIYKRKEAAPEDTFVPIKRTIVKEILIPPTTESPIH